MKAMHVVSAALAVLSLTALSAKAEDEPYGSGRWPFSGNNIGNTRSAAEVVINAGDAALLKARWVFTTAGDVSATPTVEGEDLYIPDWGGYIYKLNRWSGNVLWKVKLSDLTGNTKSVSRTAIAIAHDVVILGDQASGTVIALSKANGSLSWTSVVDPHPAAIITSSPVISQGRIYVGVASSEEGLATQPGYVPSFRGSVAALDLATGHLVWQFKTAPQGYTGSSVWGSTPAVDLKRRLLYVGTGNNYSIPAAATQCLQSSTGTAATCLSPDNWVDSALALDLDTGTLRWGQKLWNTADTFTVSCLFGLPSCPIPTGPDYDIGSGANLFAVGGGDDDQRDGHDRTLDVVGIGQKSGVYWALNPDNGQTIWSTQVGPGGTLGGIEWGSAVDGKRVYVAVTNSSNTTYTLAGGKTWNAGSWAALDARTGKFIWQIPVLGSDLQTHLGGRGLGSVSVANGIMFAGSTSGDMVALDGATGKILWHFASGGTVISGPSVVDHAIYWGSGYSHFGIGVPNNKLYAFTFP